MKNVIFVLAICIIGCYESSDEFTIDTESDTVFVDVESTEIDARIDTSVEDTDSEVVVNQGQCTYDNIKYAGNSCMCMKSEESKDHYGCCEFYNNKWGWKWYLCSSGPAGTQTRCEQNNSLISCIYYPPVSTP